MSKNTIYCKFCNEVARFKSMGEEYVRKLVIHGKARLTHENYLRQIVYQIIGEIISFTMKEVRLPCTILLQILRFEAVMTRSSAYILLPDKKINSK